MKVWRETTHYQKCNVCPDCKWAQTPSFLFGAFEVCPECGGEPTQQVGRLVIEYKQTWTERRWKAVEFIPRQ